MEPFFRFWGTVITALWLADETSEVVNGWQPPALVGFSVFVIVLMAVFCLCFVGVLRLALSELSTTTVQLEVIHGFSLSLSKKIKNWKIKKVNCH